MFLTASTVCGDTLGPTEDFAAASMRGTGVRMLSARAATVKIMVRAIPDEDDVGLSESEVARA